MACIIPPQEWNSIYSMWKPDETIYEFEKLMKKEIESMEYTFNFTPVLTGSIKATPKIEKVVFFEKTCRVFWSDGVESVAVCGGEDIYTREGALGIAIAKRFMGGYNAMNEVFEGLRETNGNSVYVRLTPVQKAEIKRQKRLALEKEKRIAAEKERQEINARRRKKRVLKAKKQYNPWTEERDNFKKTK